MKKLLTLSLALFMSLSLIVLNVKDVKAEETNDNPCTSESTGECDIIDQDSLTAWATNNNITTGTVTQSFTLDTAVTVAGTKTLDLKGKTITAASTFSGIMFTVNGTLTVKDSLNSTTAAIIGNYDPSVQSHNNCQGLKVYSGKSLTINGGTIQNMYKSGSGAAIYSSGKLIITRATISNCYANSSGAGVYDEAGGTLQINNITITDCSSGISTFRTGLTITGVASINTTGDYNSVNVNEGALTVNDGATLAVKTTGNAKAMYAGSFTPLSTQEVKGSADGSTTNLKDAYLNNGVFVTTDGNAKYVVIRPIQATPAEHESGDMDYNADKGAFVSSIKKGSESLAVHISGINATVASTTVSKKNVQNVWEELQHSDALYNVVKGTSESKFTKLTFTKGYIDGLDAGTYLFKIVFSDATANATGTTYVELTITDDPTPEPTPSPSKPADPKDESCEKVIGPTWHWNNTKGICEDYGVVGTSTR